MLLHNGVWVAVEFGEVLGLGVGVYMGMLHPLSQCQSLAVKSGYGKVFITMPTPCREECQRGNLKWGKNQQRTSETSVIHWDEDKDEL